MKDIPKLENITSQVRRDIVRMVHNKSGHPGGSLKRSRIFGSIIF